MSGSTFQPRGKVVAWLSGGLCLLGVGAYVIHRGASTTAPECRLSVPHSRIDPMVFPTKEGSAALDAAIIEDAEPAVIRRVMQEQGGFSVPHGTACEPLEAGAVYSRIVLTEGPFAGQTVWAPALHTRGG